MRIAYVTPYQGPTVLERRPIVRNRSMSNRAKIELIAQLLHEQGHDVEILSHGEVIEPHLKFYPGFSEPAPFHPEIPVTYISSLPVRRVNGLWASLAMLRLFKRRHAASPFDLVIVFNLKRPEVACVRHAVREGIPVVLEYEDDAFVSIRDTSEAALVSRYHQGRYARALAAVSGCIAVSPYLLAQVRPEVPKLLLRGVVGDDVLKASNRERTSRRNIVLFSGTHIQSNGIEELITAWSLRPPPGWELHITGFGGMTERLREMARDKPGIVFHGFVSREELVELMCSARICINPHAISETPGIVFAFKIIEYLAAGAHVITTPMGALEPAIEAGITYMDDNRPPVIAATLAEVIDSGRYDRTAEAAVQDIYGAPAVSEALQGFLTDVAGRR